MKLLGALLYGFWIAFIHATFKSKNNNFTNSSTPSSPTTIILCSEPDDIMTVTNVSLLPDPPIRGQNLSFVITGKVIKDILPDSYIMLDIRKGSIHFPKIKTPICDYITTGCPVHKDSTQIDFLFDIPKLIPGGTYDIGAIFYNADTVLNRNKYLLLPILQQTNFVRYPGFAHVIDSFLTYSRLWWKWVGNDPQNIKKKPNLLIAGERVACMQAMVEI